VLNIYHYHWTYDFPYNIGCYKGTRITTTDLEETEFQTTASSLKQNFPNPFNGITQISFTVCTPGFVTLKVFDHLGRMVKMLVNEKLSTGSYDITLDASDLEEGIYLYCLRQGASVKTLKMCQIK